ncbi:MAG: serine hydrolase [Bacteroidota bacterium]
MSQKIFFCLLLLFLPLFSFAQKDGSTYRFKQAPKTKTEAKPQRSLKVRVNRPGSRFDELAARQVVFSNASGILPIQGLDTLRVAYVGIGLPQGSEFELYLNKYTNISYVGLPKRNRGVESLEWAKSMQGQYDLFILGIEDRFAKSATYFDHHFAINAIIQNFNSVAVVFGGSSAFRYLPLLRKTDGLIITPDVVELVEMQAAQLVFGALEAKGTLQETINKEMAKGMGIELAGNLRLKYSIPEVVGMNSKRLSDSISSIINEGLLNDAYPGAQVLVAKKGNVVYHESFGYHTYKKVRPVSINDIYDWASVTKTTSALTALMKLYGEGAFDLDATLGEYLKKFKNSNKGDLTFRSMLAHNARIKSWIAYWRNTVKEDGSFKGGTFKPDSSNTYNVRVTENLWLHKNYKKKIFKAIKKSPLNEEPGFVYSGLLFYLLPDIVAGLTEEDYETYLKDTFYKPLGAHTITYNAYQHFPLEKIIPTEQDTFFRMSLLHGTVHDEGAAMMGGVSSNAGLFGSANDLAKLLQMYLKKGTYGGKRYISEEALEEFTKCQFCQEDNHRGLGFDKPQPFNPDKNYTAKSASPESFGHSGYTGTFYWVDPVEELIVIFFSNRVYPTRDNRKLYELNIRPRLHQAIYDAIDKE